MKRALWAAALLSGCNSIDQFKEAKDAVSHEMLDPESTQFRDVERCEKDEDIVMGEYNSKNSFGGYAGFKSFYVVGPIVYTIEKYTPMEIDGKTYSVTRFLLNACLNGGGHDVDKFFAQAKAGTVESDEDYYNRVEAESRAALGTSANATH